MKWALAFLAAAALAALLLCRVDGGRLPQVVKGGAALSVAFAAAKTTISAAMMQKADSYFHGGIDIECHHDHDECHEHHPPSPRLRRASEPPAPNHEPRTPNPEPRTPTPDPWLWINQHVRAPEKHIHLDDEKAVELMPWFWAAVRANPHNIDAWTTAAYAADRMIKDKALARRVIREAREKNPDSLELAWTEARLVYDEGNGDVAAAEAILEGARAIGKRLCGGRLSSLSAHDGEMYCYILDYLSKIHEVRGERAAIRPLVEEARATGADTPVVKTMEDRAAGLGR